MAFLASQTIFYNAMLTLLFVASSNGAPPPWPSPPPADCSPELVSLSGCLPYVRAGSIVEKPDDVSCCSPLKKVVKEMADCLCQILAKGSKFGISLNVTRALYLPFACDVMIPFVSNCKLPVAGAPLGSPVPGASPETTPSAGQGSPSLASSAVIFLPVPFNVLFVSALLLSVCSFVNL